MKKGTYEDKIRIEELEVYAHHGVYPEENEKGQHFYVNATLYTNTRPAGLADDLSLSTNYGEVCQFITEFMQQHTFQLIETVAERDCLRSITAFSAGTGTGSGDPQARGSDSITLWQCICGDSQGMA